MNRRLLAVHAKFREKHQQVGGTDRAISIEVWCINAISGAAEKLQEHQQIVRADEAVFIDVTGTRAQFIGCNQSVAIVVVPAVGPVSAGVNRGVAVVAVTQVRPFVIVIVDDAGTFVESRLAVVERTLGAGFLTEEGASEQTIFDDAGNLVAEATDAVRSQVELGGHASLHALLAFGEARIAAEGCNALNEFSLLAYVIQVALGAIAE